MRQFARFILATTAVLLLGSGIWANLGKAPLSQMRGVWVSQAIY
jgi:hypothetical protein